MAVHVSRAEHYSTDSLVAICVVEPSESCHSTVAEVRRVLSRRGLVGNVPRHEGDYQTNSSMWKAWLTPNRYAPCLTRDQRAADKRFAVIKKSPKGARAAQVAVVALVSPAPPPPPGSAHTLKISGAGTTCTSDGLGPEWMRLLQL